MTLYLQYRVVEYQTYGYGDYYTTKFKWLALLVRYIAQNHQHPCGGSYYVYADYRFKRDPSLILWDTIYPKR